MTRIAKWRKKKEKIVRNWSCSCDMLNVHISDHFKLMLMLTWFCSRKCWSHIVKGSVSFLFFDINITVHHSWDVCIDVSVV